MNHVSTKSVLAVAAFGAMLGGCATTLDVGPGYYHYDTGLATYRTAPAVVYHEPAVTYREPAVVYREPTVVYREPAVVYRTTPSAVFYNDHGQ